MDPHAPTSDTFAFIKKQTIGEAHFILHFAEEPVYSRLPKPIDQRLQALSSTSNDPHFHWAVSVKSGRSHDDGWELSLKKGQRVKILKDEGRNWFVAVDHKGNKGFVHGSYLDFNERARGPAAAWKKFEQDTQNLFASRNITTFLNMKDYVDVCTDSTCLFKQDPSSSSLGICCHDLEVLLKGSGCFSLEWLKDGRIMWHPDRFARLCMPEHTDRLKVQAQELFVLYGLLMEQF